MDILVLLAVFFILATVIKIATDNVVAVLRPWLDVKRYKLVIALALTVAGVFALNTGVLEALEVPRETSWPWIHEFDLILSSLFLTSGAQAIHKLSDAWKEYSKKREG